MFKIYFIYKVAGKKSRRAILNVNYVVCLSDTDSSCHVTVMGLLIVLINKRADGNALWKSK
jgi:general stress protein 26